MKRSGPLKRTTPLKRSPFPKARQSFKTKCYVKSATQKRRERFVRQFGGKHYVAFIKSQACCVCSTPAPSECSHLTSRGAGGIWRDIIPLCFACHAAWHSEGRWTFCQRRDLELSELRVIAAQCATDGATFVEE